jgi:hypothetical protein
VSISEILVTREDQESVEDGGGRDAGAAGSSRSDDALPTIENFKVKYCNFPVGVIKAMEAKKRCPGHLVNETVRRICDELHNISRYPGETILSAISREIVGKYPDTFKDPIGPGHSSLMRQLELRLAYLNRRDNDKKRASVSAVLGGEAPKIKFSKKERFGCPNWQPDTPINETPESLLAKQKWLQLEHEKVAGDVDTSRVAATMATCFMAQRCAINSHQSVLDIDKNWPFMLEVLSIIFN